MFSQWNKLFSLFESNACIYAVKSTWDLLRIRLQRQGKWVNSDTWVDDISLLGLPAVLLKQIWNIRCLIRYCQLIRSSLDAATAQLCCCNCCAFRARVIMPLMLRESSAFDVIWRRRADKKTGEKRALYLENLSVCHYFNYLLHIVTASRLTFHCLL